MYIAGAVTFDDWCVVICIIPMLTTAMVECRLFAYFLLTRERLKIINESIDFYRRSLDSIASIECHKERDSRIKSKIFFINELVGAKKINAQVKWKTDNGWKSNFAEKLKSMASSGWSIIKNLLNVRTNKIFTDNFDAPFKKAPLKNFDYIDRICSMQIIYSKLFEISDLISSSHGVQIIAIISVQFITLTTLLYYTTMKIIRLGLNCELLSVLDKVKIDDGGLLNRMILVRKQLNHQASSSLPLNHLSIYIYFIYDCYYCNNAKFGVLTMKHNLSHCFVYFSSDLVACKLFI